MERRCRARYCRLSNNWTISYHFNNEDGSETGISFKGIPNNGAYYIAYTILHPEQKDQKKITEDLFSRIDKKHFYVSSMNDIKTLMSSICESNGYSLGKYRRMRLY